MIAVYYLLEGSWFVRGTTDIQKAGDAMLDEWLDYNGPPEDEGYDVRAVYEVERVGLFRFNPCSPRSCIDGHSWHLGYAAKPGRGVFEGVHIAGVHWEPEEDDAEEEEDDGRVPA